MTTIKGILVKENNISAFIDGEPYVISRSHDHFEEIKEKLESSNYDCQEINFLFLANRVSQFINMLNKED